MFSPSDISPTSSPGPSDADGTLNKNISKILSLLETPSSAKKESDVIDTNTPNPKLKNLLQDVIAYVEVRSKFENRGKAITQQLRQLGATVVPKFTNEVTHVIFKEGKKSTKDKAKKKGIHLLSVLWIEACKKNEQHMPEKDYPANVKDESAMPFAVTRLKRCKSMQPKDFDEELASSAEKVERRRKMREKKEKWKTIDSPVTPLQFNRNQFYVAETQPMSPVFFSPSVSVPETPPSMRRKLELLRKKKGLKPGTILDDGNTSDLTGSLQESPSSAPNSPLQKKLFGSTSGSPSCSTHSSIGVTPLTADNIPEVRGSVLGNEEPLQPVKRVGLFDSILEDTSNSKQRQKPLKGTTNSVRNSPKLPERADTILSPKESVTASPKLPVSAGISADSMESVLVSPTKLLHKVSASAVAKTAGANSKTKGGKRKLMSLDEGPVEKLLSPANSNSSVHTKTGILDFPKPKKGAATKNETVSKNRKRKVGDAGLSDSSDDGKNTKSKKKTRNSPKAKDTKSKRRSLAVTTPSQPIRSSRRRSCMPALGTPSSVLKQEKFSTCTSGDHTEPRESPEYTPRAIDVDTPAKDAESKLPAKSCLVKNKMATSPSGETLATDRTAPANNGTSKKTSVIPRRSSRRSSVMHSVKLQPLLETAHESLSGKCDTDDNTSRKKPATVSSNISAVQEEEASVAGQSYMSVAYSMLGGPDTSHVKTSRRRSTQEFVISDTRKLKKKTISMSSAIDTSSSDEDIRPERKPSKQPYKKSISSAKPRKKVERSSSDSGSDISSCSNASVQGKKTKKGGPTRSMVMTSLHFSEQDCVRAVVKKFGGFFVEDTVSPNTTHVVCGNNRRTINILLAISQGCWLLSLQWVLKSLEAGYWLNESDFELIDIFPAAQKSRQDRMSSDVEYKSSLFSKQGLIYVAEHTAPPHQDLVKLLKLCGGQVTHCARKASVCVGSNLKSANSAVSVSEKWILDSITSHRELPFDEYKL